MHDNVWWTVSNSAWDRQRFGLERLSYPISFLLPDGSATQDPALSRELIRPGVTLVSDLYVEIGETLKGASLDRAREAIKGLRVGLAVEFDHVAGMLNHKATIRDDGMTVYYRRWSKRGSVIGPLFLAPPSLRKPVLRCSGFDVAAFDLDLSPADIVAFLSGFHTFLPGELVSIGGAGLLPASSAELPARLHIELESSTAAALKIELVPTHEK